MPEGTHTCARPGCVVQVPGYQLACAPDWRALPPPLRARIYVAWQRRRRHPKDGDAAGAHLELVVEAINVWVGV